MALKKWFWYNGECYIRNNKGYFRSKSGLIKESVRITSEDYDKHLKHMQEVLGKYDIEQGK